MSTTRRPFLQKRLEELRNLFESTNDPRVARRIRDELSHRKSRGARQLLRDVQLRLQEESTRELTGRSDQTIPSACGLDTVMQHQRSWEFDAAQRQIIEAPRNARQIVNAPPGTGKTAVACGRILWLLKQGVPAHQIWLFSFTRTAVRELRNRIEAAGEQRADVHAVKVATLDSRAWALVQGLAGSPLAMTLSHDSTIAQALELLQSHDDAVLDEIDEIAHVVVDEAQDLVGIRRDFVLELIRKLGPDAGVTVLTDDAQAIYGFAEDDEGDDTSGETLPQALRRQPGLGFSQVELQTVYRTSSSALRSLYIEGRRQVLEAVEQDEERALDVARSCVEQWNDGTVLGAQHQSPPDGTLQLYRTRFEALDASCWLAGRGIQHRIRMSGLPTCLHPWLALALWDYESERLTRQDLLERWPRVEDALGPLAPDPDACWRNLVRVAGHDEVRMPELRRILARSRPPLEFVTHDLGLTGPILGTIHASKGREADHVHLMLPRSRPDPVNSPEEARVLFVGATRARRTLRVGEGSTSYSSPLRGGRRYRRIRGGAGGQYRARMEIGMAGDLEPHSPVSSSLFASAHEARATQTLLAEQMGSVVPIRAWRSTRAEEYRYVLRLPEEVDGPVVGRLTAQVNSALFEAAESAFPGMSLRPPQYVGPLFMMSACSIVLSPEDPDLEQVHSPWTRSGIWLAPVVLGLPTVPFRRRRT